jgi:hypothetical protein
LTSNTLSSILHPVKEMSKRRISTVRRLKHLRVPSFLRHLTLALLSIIPTPAEETETNLPDKSRYHLFNPTPKQYLRELSADRPDKTESAFTVDAGHFQVETDFANLTYDRYNVDREDRRTLVYEIAPTTLKLGILNNLDVQVAFLPRQSQRVEMRSDGTREDHAAFGDIFPRLKLNLVGNDGGPFALAVLPFLKLPTSGRLGNRAIEGGIKFPYAIEAGEWEVSLQHEVDFFRNEANVDYHPEFVNSISVGHPVTKKLSYYVEFYSSVSAEANSEWIGTFDTWVTYQLNKNLRLDAGVYIGVTRAADDWHPFVGITWRY